jgi:GTP-binding protein Era
MGGFEGQRKTHAGFVAIVGKPNVGKSTLLNNLLGVKVAPISPKPQTTRKRLRGILTEGDRQIVFVDTPGLHRPMDALGEFMRQEVYSALVDVHAVVWVVDLRHPPTPEDEMVGAALRPLVGKVPIFLVGNKVDAAKYPEEALKAYHALLPQAETRALSALDPQQVARLKEDLLALMPEGPLLYPEDFPKSDQSLGEWAAEIIREEAMKRVWDEVPYSIAVKTEEVAERENGVLYIKAVLYGEKPSQKGILIGEGGRQIKEIGQAARRQLEALLGRRIYLDLQVRVYPSWRKDPEALRELGYWYPVG